MYCENWQKKKEKEKEKKQRSLVFWLLYGEKIDIAIVESREEMKLYCGINFVEQNLLEINFARYGGAPVPIVSNWNLIRKGLRGLLF